jgi:outer membrane protein assembly factor BamA
VTQEKPISNTKAGKQKIMKKLRGYIILILLASCSVKNKLPKSTYLYKGADIKIEKTADNKTKTGKVKSTLKNVVKPAPNKMILGYPYKVAWWYFIGETKKQKGFKHWLRNRFGEPPVLSTSVDLNANAVNMNQTLINKGYFKSSTAAGKKIKGYKMEALYKVTLPKPYLVNHSYWVLDSAQRLSIDILKNDSSKKLVKDNEQFDLANIKAERTRIDAFLKNRGYYYFGQDYIKSYIDTTVGDNKLNVFFAIRKDIPAKAALPQTINSITLFPNYSLTRFGSDTLKKNLVKYDSIFIQDSMQRFKPFAITRPVTYKPGSLYKQREHNKTLNRFINLGEFKFVKSRYEPVGDSANTEELDAYYYLTPLKKKNIGLQLGGFSKSNSFTGTRLDVNWKNRNLFKGAEQLNIKAYGAFEISSQDSLRKFNNWHLGGEAALIIPRFITPFKIKESSYFPPLTKFSVGYEWFRRQLLFTENFYRAQYELSWKENSNKEHTLSPMSITYTKPSDFSQEYVNQISQFPGLRYVLLPEVITGSFYNFLYNGKNPNATNIIYFNANLEVAGNILGAVKKPDTAYSKTIANAYFAQYAKLDIDFRYARKLSPGLYWANRISLGIGMPYGNSPFLPFTRQFLIGGSTSLRGFPPRNLGPGRVLTSAVQQVTYPAIGGDYKLEVNSELRFPIFSKLKGALFAETGNIWMKNDVLYGPDAVLTKNFLQDLAVDAGFGIRLDITLLIIRLDIAAPLRQPWLPKGSEWKFKNTGWNDLVYNFGIGYPF